MKRQVTRWNVKCNKSIENSKFWPNYINCILSKRCFWWNFFSSNRKGFCGSNGRTAFQRKRDCSSMLSWSNFISENSYLKLLSNGFHKLINLLRSNLHQTLFKIHHLRHTSDVASDSDAGHYPGASGSLADALRLVSVHDNTLWIPSTVQSEGYSKFEFPND